MTLLDLRLAIRYLLKAPGFTATALLMLALGIGATTAIFSVVEGVLLRPLPFPHPEKLVVVSDVAQSLNMRGNGESGVTGFDIQAYTRDTHSFDSLGGYQQTTYEVSGIGEPMQVSASRLSGGVFPALQVAPLLGRYFAEREDEQKERVVVLSYSFWQTRFHGDSGILGAKFLLDRQPYVVIGVMPRGFEFPLLPGHLNHSVMWVPASLTPTELSFDNGAVYGFDMVGRLKPGINSAQAQSDAERVAQETMRTHPPTVTGFTWHAVVRSLHEETVERARPLVRTLFLAVFVVMLIACANFAGLLLVRAIRRRREAALRLALGAPASALLRNAILESLLLSVTGGLLGLLLASYALSLGLSRLPETLPRINEIGLDWRVAAFALLLAVTTGLVCGLAPAFAVLRTSVNEVLKQGGRTGATGGGHARLRSALVVGEIAVAMVLLVACGLLLRSFEKMRAVDLGFRPDHTLTAYYALPERPYGTQVAVNRLGDELTHRLQQLPGVKYAGLTSFLPETGSYNRSVFVAEGYVPPQGVDQPLGIEVMVRGECLQAMGVPLLSGRFFAPADSANATLVVIVNHKLADHYWHGADPIGKRIRMDSQVTNRAPWMTIVGVVADLKDGPPDVPSMEQFYLPVDQVEKANGGWAVPTDLNGNWGYIALRSETPPQQMASLLSATVRSIDPQLALDNIQSMEQAVSDSEGPRRFNTALVSAFAIAATLLAALGIYSVIAFSAALRSHEIAIRMALGSQRSEILALVFTSALKLAVVGCALGLLGASAASHLMRSFLFGVSPLDPLVLTLGAVFVLVLSLAASLLPARRAASVDPMQALRTD